mmetsp:Transcript_51717/g.102948  ORF Transcript_51717/g.102948 Transcript_51717/m.102948 type:complete len:211 (+) Transcript_51717:127-759(+)
MERDLPPPAHSPGGEGTVAMRASVHLPRPNRGPTAELLPEASFEWARDVLMRSTQPSSWVLSARLSSMRPPSFSLRLGPCHTAFRRRSSPRSEGARSCLSGRPRHRVEDASAASLARSLSSADAGGTSMSADFFLRLSACESAKPTTSLTASIDVASVWPSFDFGASTANAVWGRCGFRKRIFSLPWPTVTRPPTRGSTWVTLRPNISGG